MPPVKASIFSYESSTDPTRTLQDEAASLCQTCQTHSVSCDESSITESGLCPDERTDWNLVKDGRGLNLINCKPVGQGENQPQSWGKVEVI